MNDYTELKRLAEAVAALEDDPEREDEHAETVGALSQHMHCHTILALIAENEALRKDAERYQWLRENSYYAHVQVMERDGSMPYVYGEELDVSVDAAMGKELVQ